jgi:hypothetical protein
MSRASVLARGRLAAEQGMVDECTIRRRGEDVTDPFSGEVTWAYDTIYEGKCRFQQRSALGGAQEREVGEAHVLIQGSEVQIPVSVVGCNADDEVVCNVSRDPDMVGRIFRIRDLAYRSDATSRRFHIQERTS